MAMIPPFDFFRRRSWSKVSFGIRFPLSLTVMFTLVTIGISYAGEELDPSSRVGAIGEWISILGGSISIEKGKEIAVREAGEHFRSRNGSTDSYAVVRIDRYETASNDSDFVAIRSILGTEGFGKDLDGAILNMMNTAQMTAGPGPGEKLAHSNYYAVNRAGELSILPTSKIGSVMSSKVEATDNSTSSPSSAPSLKDQWDSASTKADDPNSTEDERNNARRRQAEILDEAQHRENECKTSPTSCRANPANTAFCAQESSCQPCPICVKSFLDHYDFVRDKERGIKSWVKGGTIIRIDLGNANFGTLGGGQGPQ